MISRRRFSATLLPFLLAGCSSRDVINTAIKAATSGSPEHALSRMAQSKASGWARNPQSLARDLENFRKFMETFLENVEQIWGPQHTVKPQKKVYVKYSDAYKTRAIIDFEKSLVRVETLERTHLHRAIVTTVLSSDDPRAVDLFSAEPVKLGGEPFLYKQVLDQEAKAIRWEWRAKRFGDHIIKTALKSRILTLKDGKKATEYYVEFPLVQRNQATRQTRYSPLVAKYSARYKLDHALVYAIIEVESNFNPYAVSWVPAFGLMQIVPQTAGRDAFEYIHGRPGTPSSTYLFDPQNNIEMGCAYLDILNSRYLSKISNPLSKEYCVISAYNGGAGNVLKSFATNRSRALSIINRASPQAVYDRLQRNMPSESQHYLRKVLKARPKYR